MHAAIMGRPVGKVVFLLQGQCIEVGTQANAARTIAVSQHTNHPCPGDTGVHIDAPLAQSIGHQSCGSVLFKTQFRVGMDITAQSHERAHVVKIWQMEHDQPQ